MSEPTVYYCYIWLSQRHFTLYRLVFWNSRAKIQVSEITDSVNLSFLKGGLCSVRVPVDILRIVLVDDHYLRCQWLEVRQPLLSKSRTCCDNGARYATYPALRRFGDGALSGDVTCSRNFLSWTPLSVVTARRKILPAFWTDCTSFLNYDPLKQNRSPKRETET
jgi:hypothetical protein